MSKYAVLILPFFILSVVAVEPVISRSSTVAVVQGSDQIPVNNPNNQIETVELLAQNYPTIVSSENNPDVNGPKVIKVVVTAYSSSPEQTDNTPFTTASGSSVRPGVVAANFLPFGTRIKIPSVFGDEIFTVEDRLASEYNDRVDVWFSNKQDAIRFGSKISEIEIL